MELFGEACRVRAIDARLDGKDRAFADMGGLIVGKSRRADQDESHALVRRQLRSNRDACNGLASRAWTVEVV